MKINIVKSLLLVFIFSFNYSVISQNQKINKKKPNILFIFSDDQRADALGANGNGYISTPNVDKLAQTGVSFKNTYVMGGNQGAICAPSRAMLMSGKSLFHVYEKLDGVTTMPMYFNQFGYESFGTGKWHNEPSAFEASFDKGKNVMTMGMTDYFNAPVRDLDKNGKLTKPVKKGFSTDIFADSAIDYLNNYAKEGTEKPFFCYVAFNAPHDPRSPREDYIGMYKDEAMPLPGNFKGWHPFKFDNMNIRDETLGPWPRTPEMIRASLADYYALISHMDKRIGDIIQTLKNKNLFDNTIIVFASDNGLGIGSHGLLGKQNLYEHSTKVPLIISGPGITKNQKSDALLYLFDIFPTLTDLCELPKPTAIDGKSFTPLLKGKNMETRKSLYTVYRNTVRAVRTNEWKLIKYPKQNYQQLFNLVKDSIEINNLAYKPEYKDKVKELSSLMAGWYKSTDDTANMNPDKILPMEYDYKKLKQRPDNKQPKYILDKYFKGVDLSNVKKTNH
ncbi:sulfatase-like hydrolase/transferase [Polaribacter sargassicola]|uniref:sulfatase-like hydrolase/transferase n=1 Tax=Polaribacter sargassicola TaxID=2836891 RepID=UPI001F002298|nr:sulfatase-like hydrolase/transferase [Polaribacter sp. DS7-9]MCG1035812.1 sulfatase-like hydrolase/transferase [Polaribacter sp. DS7-9]